jgi:hypothetical protein
MVEEARRFGYSTRLTCGVPGGVFEPRSTLKAPLPEICSVRVAKRV